MGAPSAEPDTPRARPWRSPLFQLGGGCLLFGAVLAVPGTRNPAAVAFVLVGAFLVCAHIFGPRLLKARVGLAPGVEASFELAQEARDVTTAIVATPEPVQELGPDEEDDVIRWLLAELLLSQLLLQPVEPLTDCRFQLYLYDPDRQLLMPILEPGHPGPSPGFAPHQGTVGQAWATNDYVVATGPAVSDGTFGLTAEQQTRYRDTAVAAAVPITNAAGRVIGVVSGSSRDERSVLGTTDGLDVQIFLAEATALILVDLLKWFSDGYDEKGERGVQWQVLSGEGK